MSDDEMPPPNDTVPPEPAKPVYDQAFFLDLARPRADTDEARAEARERWNAWRRDPANEEVRVTFEGVDFSAEENLLISFSSFEFGDSAFFSNAKFHSKVFLNVRLLEVILGLIVPFFLAKIALLDRFLAMMRSFYRQTLGKMLVFWMFALVMMLDSMGLISRKIHGFTNLNLGIWPVFLV